MTDYPLLKKISLTIFLIGVVAALGWPNTTNVTVNSKPVTFGLQQKIIIIDPGHGGADPGAIAGDLNEAHLNMTLSLALQKELEKHGAVVKLTRHENAGLIPERTMTYHERWSILQKRKDYAISQKGDILVSIHINSDKDSRTSGAMVFYSDNRSRELASIIQENLNSLGLKPRKSLKNNFAVISELDIPAVLVEAGFITNKKDRSLILDKPTMIAQMICNGILEYEIEKQKKPNF